jgi:hypothetical protein
MARRSAGRTAGSRLLPAALVLAATVAGACTESSNDASRDAAAGNCFAEGWKECETEPYPFTSPPPVKPTAIDGTYTRTISEKLAWAPGNCRRCPPYRLEPGDETLVFDSGRFFVTHQPPGFRSSGHFVLSDNQILLYNDANCVGFEGTYRWEIANGELRLEAIEDECPFTRLRQRFLMAKDWNVAFGE